MNAQDKKDRRKGIWSRRDFFTRLGWGGFGIFSFLTLLGFIRSAFPGFFFSRRQTLKPATRTTMSLVRSTKNSSKSIGSGSCGKKPASMLCLRSALTSAAPRDGWRPRTNLNARAMGAASTKTEQTLKVQLQDPWIDLRSQWEKTDSSLWIKARCTA